MTTAPLRACSASPAVVLPPAPALATPPPLPIPSLQSSDVQITTTAVIPARTPSASAPSPASPAASVLPNQKSSLVSLPFSPAALPTKFRSKSLAPPSAARPLHSLSPSPAPANSSGPPSRWTTRAASPAPPVRSAPCTPAICCAALSSVHWHSIAIRSHLPPHRPPVSRCRHDRCAVSQQLGLLPPAAAARPRSLPTRSGTLSPLPAGPPVPGTRSLHQHATVPGPLSDINVAPLSHSLHPAQTDLLSNLPSLHINVPT